METQTSEMLQKLAEKLGTTTEYLWNVLLKQAPISSTVTLFQFAVIGIASFLLYKVHRRLLKPSDDNEKSMYRYENGYDKYGAATGLPMILAAITLSFLIIVCLFSMDDIVNGYFNPEYWALETILKSVKKP